MSTTEGSEDNPLLELLSAEEQRDLARTYKSADLEAAQERTGLTRRQILQAGAALAVGAGAGGLTVQEFAQRAQAGASTSDGDGNVGLPGDRVDVFGDGVDTLTQTLSEQNTIYAYGSNGNYVEAFPISDFADAGAAIQAAHDQTPAGCTIELPAADLSLSTQPVFTQTKKLVGQGNLQGTKLTNPRTNGTAAIKIDGGDAYRFEKFHVAGTFGNNGDVGILVKADNGSVRRSAFRDINVTGTGSHCIHLDGTGSANQIFNIGFDNIFVGNTQSSGTDADALFLDGCDQIYIGQFYGNSADRHVLYAKDGLEHQYDMLIAGPADDSCIKITANRVSAGMLKAENGNADGLELGCGFFDIGVIHVGGSAGSGVHFNGAARGQIGCLREHSSTGSGLEFSNTVGLITVATQNVSGSVTFNGDSIRRIEFPTDPAWNGARGQTPSSGTLTASFTVPFVDKPTLDVTTESEAIWWVSGWSTNSNGYYEAATLSFVDNAGSAVNPTTHWKARI